MEVLSAETDVKTAPRLDVGRVRQDFPILASRVHGHPLRYLDNAATTQKPDAVIDAVSGYYRTSNANVHRAVHHLSERATAAYEAARAGIAKRLNAASTREIIFTRGTTESINLIASTFGRSRIGAGDEVLISGMEHHSNIVPWQLLCDQTGAKLRVIHIDDNGDLDLDSFHAALGPKTRLVSIVYVSNALGTINPVREIIAAAHAQDVPVLLDAAQAVPHIPVDIAELDCDFLAISGHKVFGPTGIGVLWGRESLLESLPPYQGGGDMIRSVSFDKTTYNDLPFRFEAGTPHISGAIGMAAALDYVHAVGYDAIAAHEDDLLEHATALLAEIPQVRLIGTARKKASVVSFVVDGVHPHDIGTMLDRQGIAVRTGHHCTQPLMERFDVPATTRASLALYNTRDELDALARALRETIKAFA